MYRGLKRLKMA